LACGSHAVCVVVLGPQLVRKVYGRLDVAYTLAASSKGLVELITSVHRGEVRGDPLFIISVLVMNRFEGRSGSFNISL